MCAVAVGRVYGAWVIVMGSAVVVGISVYVCSDGRVCCCYGVVQCWC